MEQNSDKNLVQILAAYEAKLDAIYTSVEKTRKYFLWTMIISIAMIVLPLIGLVVVLPMAMHTLFGSASTMFLQDVAPAKDTATLLQNVTETAKLLR